MDILHRHIEALIFSADDSISFDDIKQSLENSLLAGISDDELIRTINELTMRYKQPEYSFEIREMANGYCFMTKPYYHNTIGSYLKLNHYKKLSRAALETLSIIAYKQPVTRIEIESIRGVNCEYTLQKLLEKELVEIEGRSDSPGRPLIYITSTKFMDYFGIKSIKDLPKLKEIVTSDYQIGEQAPIEEEITPKDSAGFTEEE